MNRMLVVVFDSENRAYEGKDALLKLDDEGIISVYAHAMLAKHADGTVAVKKNDDFGPFGTLAGAELGALIGILGGPMGLAIATGAGVLAGGAVDLNNIRIGDDFVDEVTKKLLPGKFAVVADVEEESTGPVDRHMEPIGGLVFRRSLSDVKHTIHEEHIKAMKADLAQMKAEHAKAHVDRKSKLEEKISQLDSKIQAQLQKAKDRREGAERQAKAKAEILKSKADALRAKEAEIRI